MFETVVGFTWNGSDTTGAVDSDDYGATLEAESQSLIGFAGSTGSVGCRQVSVSNDVVPVCDYGGVGEDQDRISLPPPLPRAEQCRFADPADQAAKAFLHTNPAVSRDGDVLTMTSTAGQLVLRLVDDTTPAIEFTQPTAPPLEVPEVPERPEPETGRPSTPWIEQRAGSTGPGSADIPLPEDWEATEPTTPSASIVGRGWMSVHTVRLGDWTAERTDYSLVGGPATTEVVLYTTENGQVVETGQTAIAQRHVFDSNSTIAREIVWVFNVGDRTVVATVGFPNLEGEPFVGRNSPLAGLDPDALFADFRIFV